MSSVGGKRATADTVLAHLARHGACIDYEPALFGNDEATGLFGKLQAELCFPPEQSKVFVCGALRTQPRLVVAYGDPGTSYRYSGCAVAARPWAEAPTLATLRSLLAERTGFRSNFVLANLYRNGADSIAAHRDDERDLGPQPLIMSMSFGAERDLRFARHGRAGRDAAQLASLTLAHGSLLVMSHPTNRDWTHAVLKAGGKRPERIGSRLSLTWREVLPARS